MPGRAAGARQVPVRVVREVHVGRSVRHRLVGDAQRAPLVEGVRHRDLQPAREALLAVLGDEGQAQSVLHRGDRPHALVEAPCPAVQRVRAVVRGQGARASVEGEAGAGDPVGVPADEGAQERLRIPEIALQVGEPQHHVPGPPVPVRHLDVLDDPAVRQDPYPYARPLQGPTVHRRAVGKCAEEFVHVRNNSHHFFAVTVRYAISASLACPSTLGWNQSQWLSCSVPKRYAYTAPPSKRQWRSSAHTSFSTSL